METADSSSLVSIIVFSYNHKAFLNEFIDSVPQNVRTSHNFVFCDKSSIDGSLEELRSIGGFEESRVRYLSFPLEVSNLQILRSVLESVQTPYFIGISLDDKFGEGYFTQLYEEVLKSNYSHSFAANFTQEIFSGTEEIKIRTPRLGYLRLFDQIRFSIGNPFISTGAMYPTHLVREILNLANLNKYMIEDYFLALELFERVPIVSYKNIRVKYRDHSLGLSKQVRSKEWIRSVAFMAGFSLHKSPVYLKLVSMFILLPRWIRHFGLSDWPMFLRYYKVGYSYSQDTNNF